MPVTLADYRAQAPDKATAAVIDTWRRESFALDILPFETHDELVKKAMRTKGLPSVGWRRIGADFSESKASVDWVSENLHHLGAYIDMDTLLLETRDGPRQLAFQADAILTAQAYEFNDKFVNGNPTVTPDAIAGLWWRLQNQLTGQQINGGGIDVSPDSSTLAADEDKFIDFLAQLVHKLDMHSADDLIMNEQAKMRLESALRKKGLFAQDQDQFGRLITRWGAGGPRIIDLGVKADQSTQIIGNVELSNGTALTGGAATSVYGVKYGAKYLSGWNLYPPRAGAPFMLDDGVTKRRVVEYPVGLQIVSPRSIARIYGVIAA